MLLVLSLQVFSVYSHAICFVDFCHGSTRGVNTAINLRLRWFMVFQIVYMSLYIFCLAYFYCLTNINSWLIVLRPAEWTFLNISLCVCVFLLPWAVDGEQQRQTVVDVVATLLPDCDGGKLKCEMLSTMLLISVYLGLFTVIVSGCLAFVASIVQWNYLWRQKNAREKIDENTAGTKLPTILYKIL